VKLQPRLILTSLCVLLYQVELTPAQEAPKPRFGYGSSTQAASRPAPKAAPKPASKATMVKDEPKPASAKKAPGKPTEVVAKTSVKPTSAKSSPKIKPETAKNDSKKAPSPASGKKDREPALNLAKPKAKTRETSAPPQKKALAKTSPATADPKPSPKPRKENASTRAATPERSTPNTSRPDNAPPRTGTKGIVADITGTKPADSFHFFGVPVPLPKVPALSKTGPAKSVDTSAVAPRTGVVDLMAARHSLTGSRQPGPPPLEKKQNPPITPPGPAHVDPDIRSMVPESALEPAAVATVSLDDPSALRSSLTSLQMPSTSLAPDITLPPSLESTLADEPALPAPVRTASAVPAPKAKASHDPITPDSVTESPLELPSLSAEEPALPEKSASAPETKALAKGVKATPKKAAPAPPDEKPGSSAEADLSERERAFVRSLAEAAGSVTTGSGQLNTELPRSIATSAVLEHLPEGSTATFRSAAEEVKKEATAIVQDLVPELPMEISNDLMPATPDKMPDAMPVFNAPASGKIDITSDRQADYDQVNNKVIFTGKVELNSATIRLRAERVEVFMKTGGGGMERVEASGHILMRTQDTANGPGQMASAGRASYNLKSGEIVLADWPKIQETGKSHISTDPSTKMVMFTDGRLRTEGPNRTIIGGGN